MSKHLKIILVSILLLFFLVPCVIISAETYYDENGGSMPSWYPDNPATFPNFHGTDLERVVDDANLLTPEQAADLSERVQNIVDTYDTGFVIFTDNSSHGLSKEVYAADFLLFNGYGVGDDFRGTVLFLCMEQGNRGWRTISTGSNQNFFTEDNINGIDDAVEDHFKNGDYYKAFSVYLDKVEFLFKHRRLPVSSEKKTECLGIGLIVGLIISKIRISSMKNAMKMRPDMAAANYLVDNSMNIRNKQANFLYSTLTKTPKPSENRSSGGGSSFGGGSSSNGTSFSGGGRDF